jgi:hypothetical protein
MSEKIILTDCDGVLLDWEAAFFDWMVAKGYTIKATAVYNIGQAFGIPKELGKELVSEFNDSAWIGFLAAQGDARSGVAKLVEKGYKFVVITSLSTDEKAKMLRVSNLKNIFGKNVFIDVICLGTGLDKDAELEPYRDSGLYWIEDKPENAELGLKLGLKSILIEHEHNVEHDAKGMLYAKDWEEINLLIK